MNLEKILKDNKITQKELAKEINLTPAGINNYIKGKTEPNIDTLIKIANYFNISLDYLVDRPYSNDIGFITNDEKELLNNYKKLNKINKIKILAELKGFLIAQN